MQSRFQRITPFLWFDGRAEEAARYYTSIFANSKIESTTHYSDEAAKASGQPNGSVMTVAFQLDGQDFVALNGGPHFQFSLAISFVVNCESQQEVDHFWERLSAGGDETAQQCGWLKDKFGVSWQIVPTALPTIFKKAGPEKSGRVMSALLKMKKLDIQALNQAAEDGGAR